MPFSAAAATAAKSLQSCPTLCDPMDCSLPGFSVHGILQARTLEWVAISFSNAWKWKVKVKLLSRVWLFATPWTAAYQAPPSMGFSRQQYWSGVPLPSPMPFSGVWEIPWHILLCSVVIKTRVSQVVLVVKIHLPKQETREMWVWSLGWEGPLEKGTATHSSILAWRIPGTEEPGVTTSWTWLKRLNTWSKQSKVKFILIQKIAPIKNWVYTQKNLEST